MTEDRLKKIVEKFPELSIGVVGDFFLDKFLETDPALSEISVETGKVANQVVSVRIIPGAAGNVVNNLASLGAGKIFAIGFTGDDGESYDLNKYLEKIGCDTRGLLKVPEKMTPTYLKPRNVHISGLKGEYERYDTKNRTETPAYIEKEIIGIVKNLLSALDALIILDQIEMKNCGVITENVRNKISNLAEIHKDKIFFADSRRHIGSFKNIIVKPNQYEIMGIENPSGMGDIDISELKKTVMSFRKEVKAPIFATCGSKGIIVSDPTPVLVSGVALDNAINPTGAGDSVSAGTVLALASGADYQEAAIIGNLTASVSIEFLGGCGTCTPSKLIARHKIWVNQQKTNCAG